VVEGGNVLRRVKREGIVRGGEMSAEYVRGNMSGSRRIRSKSVSF